MNCQVLIFSNLFFKLLAEALYCTEWNDGDNGVAYSHVSFKLKDGYVVTPSLDPKNGLNVHHERS